MAEEIKSNRRVNITAPSKNTEITKIIKIKDDKEPNFYKCCYCGQTFTKLDVNFPASQSELYAGLDYHLPICRKCLDVLFEHYTVAYGGDEDMAIRRICESFNLYFNISLLNASRKITKNRSRIHTYISRANLQQYKDKTYDTTLDEERKEKKEEIIESKEHLGKLKADGVVSSSLTTVDRWGAGLTEWDYSTLDDHYKMIKKNNPNCDNNQEIFIKALCNLNWLMMKTLRTGDGDSDKYVKLTEQYSKTFKQAGLKTIEEKDASKDEVFGVTLATISMYTPEEYYLNKDLYKDHDEIGDYVSRHMLRPLKNLQTDSTDRDFEFFVPDTEEELDEDDE